MKNSIKVIFILIVLIVLKLWIGVYKHDEFGTLHLFIKHRPIWKSYFYSPRGMSDMKAINMSQKNQEEQKFFDEFVLENIIIE